GGAGLAYFAVPPIARSRALFTNPAEDRFGVLVRRKHRIQAMDDPAAGDEQRQSLQQPDAFDLERRQTQPVGELKAGVAQQFERQMQPVRRLALVLGGLRAQAVDNGAESAEFRMAIAIGAGLR